MISFKIKSPVYFLLFLILATPLYADIIVTEKGNLGELRWWSDQVVTSEDIIYILGHLRNSSDELSYKLYTVNTITDEKSEIVLTWEDGRPVQLSQNTAGFLDSSHILLHWWEPDYYAAGNGAEVTGALNIATGVVSKWQADPAPDYNASKENKTGVIADLRSTYTNGSYVRDKNFFLKQGLDKDGVERLYRYNTSTRLTESADITEKYSNIIGFNVVDNSINVLWQEKLSDNSSVYQYGIMKFDGTVQDIKTFPELKSFDRSYQHGNYIWLTGQDFFGTKKLYKFNTVTGEISSFPFADQSIRYDIYASNTKGQIITLWWDAAAQKEKYGTIENNTVITLTGGATVKEDIGTVTLTAHLTNASTGTVTVNLSCNESGNDTALYPGDYNYDKTITILPGNTTGTASITINDDDLHEPGAGEYLTISVSTVMNAEEADIQIVKITIIETDNDGDGLPDDWETENNAYDPYADNDMEGLTNLEEYQYKTDPNNPDSDNDGLSDKIEIVYGTDPNVFDTEVPDPIIIYVNEKAAGDGNGRSWESAFTEFYNAVALFPFLLPGSQVWIAAGTYFPDTAGLGNPRDASFMMRKGVSIFGGFAGTESSRDERDSVSNKTILSGDIGVQGDDSDNCYHVFYHPKGLDIDETAMLDGVIISGGNANGDNSDSQGGGMYNNECSPTISQVVFTNNKAEYGGGLCNINSEPVLTGCVFIENSASDSGGGIYNSNATLNIEKSIFEANQAENFGGGISNDISFLSLINCLFFENFSNVSGGALDADESDIEIKGCTVTENNGGNNGGGLFGSATHLEITGSIFWNNSPEEIKTLNGYDNIEYSNIAGIERSNGNLSGKPRFNNPENNDFSLMADSPCVNSGDRKAVEENYGQTDLAGNPRISDGRIDMGAFESFGYDDSSNSGCFIGIISWTGIRGWNKE